MVNTAHVWKIRAYRKSEIMETDIMKNELTLKKYILIFLTKISKMYTLVDSFFFFCYSCYSLSPESLGPLDWNDCLVPIHQY